MPVYNGEAFIAESIRSVIQQSFRDWELIVVDDASSDSSVDRVKVLCAEDGRIRLIELEHNSGAAIARNMAIENAQGRYLAFLDADDRWLPHKLDLQLAFMQQTSAAFSFSAYERVDAAGKKLTSIGVPGRLRYQDLLKTNYIGCSTAIYDTSLVGKVMMPPNTKREDLATWLKVLQLTDYAYGLNHVLTKYRVYSGQASRNKANMAKENWRLYRDVEGLNFYKSVFYFFHYAVRGLLRSRFPELALKLGVLHKVQERY
jgi:teichuronic acid biosynthesis glycosyltransferase TuaG